MKIGSNSHCLLDNCKMIDGKSSGVSTSQIKKERFFDKIAIINLYGKFCTIMDTVLSVCLNQQLQKDDLVAQCVSKVIDFAAHSQLFPGLYEHNFHDFTFCLSNCILLIIYTIAVRVTKL